LVDHLAEKPVHGDVSAGLRLSPELGTGRDQAGEQWQGQQQVANSPPTATALRAGVEE